MVFLFEEIENHLRIVLVVIELVIGTVIFMWPKITRQKHTTQYNAKKLNDTVYKKLMRVSCMYNVFLFSEKLGFVIPSDERAFHNKNSGIYQMWMFDTIEDSIEDSIDNRYNKMDSVIPNLHVGEKHLKQNYKYIYKEWAEIKQFVDTHNKKHDDFLELLGNSFMKKISNKLPTFKDFAKIKDEDHVDTIYLKNIINLLYDFIQHNLCVDNEVPHFDKKMAFDDLFVSNSSFKNFWMFNHSHRNGKFLMFSATKDVWNIEKIQEILNSILNDRENIERFQKTKEYDYNELYEKIKSFTDKLENEVVHDIENQL